jgi:hypothetical protein
MRRAICILGLVFIVTSTAVAAPLTLGLGAGFDPTGIFLINALTERALGEGADLRVEVGLASGNLVGLMLLSGSLLAHRPFLPLDPFAGVGGGLAVTRVPSIGLTLEGILGTRILLFEPVGALVQVRYIFRLSASGLSAGPLYEAALLVSF